MKKLRKYSLLIFLLVFLQGCGPGYLPNYQALNAQALNFSSRENLTNQNITCYSGNTQVDRVVDRISQASNTRGWCVRVEKDESFNAYVTPDKQVVVHTGLINFIKSDDELAAIVGHEMAHVVMGHGHQNAKNRQTEHNMRQGAPGVSTSANEKLGRQIAALAYSLLVTKPNSRERELEADSLGLMYLHNGDYDPSAGVRVWVRMMEAQGGENAVSEFFSTHPISSSRIINLMRVLAGVYQNE